MEEQHSDSVKFFPDDNEWRVQNKQKLEFLWFEGKQSHSKIFAEYSKTMDDLTDENLDDENEALKYSLSSDEDDDLLCKESN